MFSGKTERLLKLASETESSGGRVAVIKPTIDFRTPGEVVSHAGTRHSATEASSAAEVSAAAAEADLVAIDEVQFFDDESLSAILELRNRVAVVAAGLDFDYRAKPFPAVEALGRVADDVEVLSAICSSCGREATLTQRFVNGVPADPFEPTYVVGGAEIYQPRCRECYESERKTAALLGRSGWSESA